jgi:hypothetical protein
VKLSLSFNPSPFVRQGLAAVRGREAGDGIKEIYSLKTDYSQLFTEPYKGIR